MEGQNKKVCGKVIYPTQKEAVAVMKATKKFKSNYFCDDCNGWHVSSGKPLAHVKKKKWAEQRSREQTPTERQQKKFDQLFIHTPRNFKIK